MKVALLQMTSSDDPQANLRVVCDMLDECEGSDLILTPEVTNCLSASRTRQNEVLEPLAGNQFLAEMKKQALTREKWLLLGSLAIKTEDPAGRFANRSFLIAPDGRVVASYDKIHMFDVRLSENESYRESAGYRPGKEVVLADTPIARLGLTICYDLRFPHLYRTLATQGAQIITVPSAFAPSTGAAHWETLLRARAIETGAYVVAPAQTGSHPTTRGKQRHTYGHSLVVDPWGRVVLDADVEPGVFEIDLNLELVDQARQRIGAWNHNPEYSPPECRTQTKT